MTQDGEIKYVKNYVIPTRFKDNEVTEAIGGFIDVTDIVFAESLARLTAFLTIIVHDLKSPLAVILMSLNLLKRSDDKVSQEKKFEIIERIDRSTKFLNCEIENMLMLAKMHQGDTMIDKEPGINIKELLEECMEEAESIGYVVDHPIILRTEGDYIIETNSQFMKRIILNLLSNASKYSPRESIIEINASEKENSIRIQIIDHGMGIPESDLPNILNKIGRGSNTKGTVGSGFGLHTVNIIAEALNCDISLESELDVGTTVTITIPNENIVISEG